MIHQLFVTAVYTDHQTTQAILKLVRESECQLIDINLSYLSYHLITTHFNISGSWDHVALFETHFSLLQKRHHLSSIIRRIAPQLIESQNMLPYQAYVVAPNQAYTLNNLMQFFMTLPVTLYDVATHVYQAMITRIDMIEISITFLVPMEQHISVLRENILQFCDEHNFEIVLEQKRH